MNLCPFPIPRRGVLHTPFFSFPNLKPVVAQPAKKVPDWGCHGGGTCGGGYEGYTANGGAGRSGIADAQDDRRGGRRMTKVENFNDKHSEGISGTRTFFLKCKYFIVLLSAVSFKNQSSC